MAGWRSTTTSPSAPCAPWPLGRKNWLFAGSDGGGEAAAVFYTLIETAKSNGHNPRLWLTHVLEAIGRERDLTDHDALLPWAMPPEPATS
ncbi:transposase domain-containing protein [Azospirillum sp. Marseille-Q6669]